LFLRIIRGRADGYAGCADCGGLVNEPKVARQQAKVKFQEPSYRAALS
jgi:hypothetical protein